MHIVAMILADNYIVAQAANKVLLSWRHQVTGFGPPPSGALRFRPVGIADSVGETHLRAGRGGTSFLAPGYARLARELDARALVPVT
jgi:hypothetical protein